MLLRIFGASMDRGSKVYPTTWVWAPWNLTMREGSCMGAGVDCYCVDRIELGMNATVSLRTFLCTASHDIHDPRRALVTAPILIGSDVFVFAEAFVGPSVKIGSGAVVAARAVVVRDVAPWTVVAGNPAKPIAQRVLRNGASSTTETCGG